MDFLPSYQELKTQFLRNDSQKSSLESYRQTVNNILNRTDPRQLLIVGPCSIHDTHSTLEFASKLKKLISKVEDQFFILMRVYCEKPRTSTGWKGFLYDPHLDGSNDILSGIRWTRQLLLQLVDMQVPAATEFLDPLTALYYEDLISWGSIGARTSSSQPHRQLASGLNMPVGFKNGVAGNLSAAVNGVLSASLSHVYMGLTEKGRPGVIKTKGNPHGHIVLRGGESGPNFDKVSVADALERLKQLQLPERLLIDCSHQNSGKKHDKQLSVFQSVLEQIMQGNSKIRGFMLESHLNAGQQDLAKGLKKLAYGISITDACLDFHTTEQLILKGATMLRELPKEAHSFSADYDKYKTAHSPFLKIQPIIEEEVVLSKENPYESSNHHSSSLVTF